MKLPHRTPEWELEFDRQAKLIYSLVVAGKSANFADKAVKSFLGGLAVVTGNLWKDEIEELPFTMLRAVSSNEIRIMLRNARTGNYDKLTRAIADILRANFDLSRVTPAQLETIHGIGPKSSRFFIMWIRPEEKYAALDVHVLRWMASLGYDVPKHTPQNALKYAAIERQFLALAEWRGMTPRQLDVQIWEAGAGRTQEKAI